MNFYQLRFSGEVSIGEIVNSLCSTDSLRGRLDIYRDTSHFIVRNNGEVVVDIYASEECRAIPKEISNPLDLKTRYVCLSGKIQRENLERLPNIESIIDSIS